MMTRGLVGTEGNMAELYSPIFKPKSINSCLSFYYHMFGSMIGKLQIFISYNGLYFPCIA